MTDLVVEDGTGRDDANSLVSLANLKSYCDDRGKGYSSFSDDELNQALIRASAFMANAFNWCGLKVNGRDQLMPFPRYSLTDREGWSVPYTEVPREVVHATCEVAFVEAGTPGAMAPSVTQSEKVRSEQVGPIRVEYANLFNSPNDARPVLLAVQDLLWPFLGSNGPVMLSGKSIRV